MSHALRLLALLVIVVAPTAAQRAIPSFPARLDSFFRNGVMLTPAERKQLAGGEPVTRLLDADPSKEVAVFGAIWINAPMQRYVEAVNDIESFERGGGFKITRRISAPPRLEDFALLRLPPEDLADLRRCRLGDCEIKLGEQALDRFRTQIDWKAPNADAAANRLMQQITLEYVNRYLEGGNAQLAVYRDDPQPTPVARELRSMVDQMPALTAFMPNVRRYLLEFPKTTLPEAKSFLYWQETDFGLKPTIRISHLTVLEGPEDVVVASKMLYASHYFWAGLELRALVPDPSRGPGFWFVTINRSRSDGLSGFTGLFVRRRVRREVRDGALTVLRTTQRKLETPRTP
jgi:hypothetical protein